eukprot:Skav221088  [mRNA]  locus=scaffold1024:38389:38688:+ [translate_table: standard]
MSSHSSNLQDGDRVYVIASSLPEVVVAIKRPGPVAAGPLGVASSRGVSTSHGVERPRGAKATVKPILAKKRHSELSQAASLVKVASRQASGWLDLVIGR